MSEESENEKTEAPSPKRLEEAYKRGNVPSSQEVPNFAVLLAAVLIVNMALPYMAQTGLDYNKVLFSKLHEVRFDPVTSAQIFYSTGAIVFKILVIPFAMIMSLAVLSHLVQHKFLVSASKIAPQYSRISPMAGFKRLFSMASLMNFLKGILKMSAVGIAVFLTVWPVRHRIEPLVATPVEALLTISKGMVISTINSALIIIGLIAAVDYFMARRKWWNGLKMSLEDIKQEFKTSEGDPKIKAKMRQIGMQRIRRNLAQVVPKATVIITNPTHYAVALQYEKDMQAPVCLAKGFDALALRIRELAEENEVPLVENPALARALYASAEIDQEIPIEHYKAVAEIIGYVYRLRQKAKGWRAS